MGPAAWEAAREVARTEARRLLGIVDRPLARGRGDVARRALRSVGVPA